MTTSQGYIFYSLQHSTTKLHNFSKRGMLFQAVVIFLPISIFFKILSNGGKVHYEVGNCISYYILAYVIAPTHISYYQKFLVGNA